MYVCLSFLDIGHVAGCVRSASFAAACQGRQKFTLKAAVLGLIVFLEVEYCLFLTLQFGATLGAGGVCLVRLEEGREMGHAVTITSLSGGYRVGARHSARTTAADRTICGEIYLAGIVAGQSLPITADLSRLG